MKFRKITIEDRDWIRSCVAETDYKGSSYSFAVIMMWQDSYKTEVARFKDFAVFRSTMDDGYYAYAMPVGRGDLREVIEELRKDAKRHGQTLRIYCVEDSAKFWLKTNMAGEFSYEPSRDAWDYVYDREALATLKGKKYAGKRNHINRFIEDGDWHYERLDETNVDDCMKMAELWYAEAVEKGNTTAIEEKTALEIAVRYFNELELTGGVLYKDEKLVAFTIGEALSKDTYHVLIEKAYADINGAYPMINQQYVENEMSRFKYVNREEDTGLPGLRKAKESYHPAFMVEKYMAISKF
jgi:hypothetical protein